VVRRFSVQLARQIRNRVPVPYLGRVVIAAELSGQLSPAIDGATGVLMGEHAIGDGATIIRDGDEGEPGEQNNQRLPRTGERSPARSFDISRASNRSAESWSLWFRRFQALPEPIRLCTMEPCDRRQLPGTENPLYSCSYTPLSAPILNQDFQLFCPFGDGKSKSTSFRKIPITSSPEEAGGLA
jgi:hypothetical protein